FIGYGLDRIGFRNVDSWQTASQHGGDRNQQDPTHAFVHLPLALRRFAQQNFWCSQHVLNVSRNYDRVRVRSRPLRVLELAITYDAIFREPDVQRPYDCGFRQLLSQPGDKLIASLAEVAIVPNVGLGTIGTALLRNLSRLAKPFLHLLLCSRSNLDAAYDCIIEKSL